MGLRVLFAIHAIRDPHTAVFMNVCSRREHLQALGHTADIIAPSDLGMRADSGLRPLMYGVALASRARLSSYDLIVFHSHSGWAFSLLKRLIPSWRRTAVVTAFHGFEPLYHEAEQRELARMGRRYGTLFRLLHVGVLPWLTKLSCRTSDAVFCLNSAERDYLLSRGWCTPDRAVIVHNGVERELFTVREHRGRGSVLLFVGQWLPRKGIRYLVEAFASLAERYSSMRLVCAGTGLSAGAVLEDFPPGLRARVRVAPQVDRAALGRLLREADLFVFPSLFEGSSGALLEAMAASLAIVASPAGAAADILQDGRHALVVPCADARALAAAMERAVLDDEFRSRLGRAAHDAALAYEWSLVNEQYCAHLLDAVQSHLAGSGVAASV